MKYIPTKKSLKLGMPQNVVMMVYVSDMDIFIQEYGLSSIQEGFKFLLELKDEYINLHFNYGYSITNIKVAQIDDAGFCEYRCRATIEKL